MEKFFYIDESGKTHGPIGREQLNELAASGIVTPKTIIGSEDGKSLLAGMVKGLVFAAMSPPSSLDGFSPKLQMIPHNATLRSGAPVPFVKKCKRSRWGTIGRVCVIVFCFFIVTLLSIIVLVRYGLR